MLCAQPPTYVMASVHVGPLLIFGIAQHLQFVTSFDAQLADQLVVWMWTLAEPTGKRGPRGNGKPGGPRGPRRCRRSNRFGPIKFPLSSVRMGST